MHDIMTQATPGQTAGTQTSKGRILLLCQTSDSTSTANYFGHYMRVHRWMLEISLISGRAK